MEIDDLDDPAEGLLAWHQDQDHRGDDDAEGQHEPEAATQERCHRANLGEKMVVRGGMIPEDAPCGKRDGAVTA